MPQKVSAVTFAYNEARDIGECLDQLKPWVDEILVCDLDSTDGTADEAMKHTPRVHRVPHLICGDYYKQWLQFNARGDWMLWFYPDERFSAVFLRDISHLTDSADFDAYSLMRHEYRDGIRLMPHGTPESPNYQNRLHRRGHGIFYTELVHAEIHGKYRHCPLPPEYYMEHKKSWPAQEFDNYRLYVEMKHLIWKYRETQIEPYRSYIKSYRQIISESEAKNESGERMILPMEEFWWDWFKLQDMERIPKWKWSTVKKELEESAHAKA